MIVNHSIIANMSGLRTENMVCSLPMLQFNKFYGYETCSMSSKAQNKPKDPPQSIPRGTYCWMFEFGARI